MIEELKQTKFTCDVTGTTKIVEGDRYSRQVPDGWAILEQDRYSGKDWSEKVWKELKLTGDDVHFSSKEAWETYWKEKLEPFLKSYFTPSAFLPKKKEVYDEN